ncbi:MAG TPA: hypothetical protein VFH63_07860 [candidate division Zixibacteria bacterium]|nr:hypothetical protein [candidate division Zixibacteria bacterium]
MVTTLLLPSGVQALSVDGCRLSIVSTDAGGATIGRVEAAGGQTAAAVAPAEAVATRSRPLPVDSGGRITWQAELDGASGELRARLSVFGLPIASGPAGRAGTLALDDVVPFRVAGLLHVTAELHGERQTCTASGWVRLQGDPVGTLPFLVALLFGGLGLVLVGAALRGAWPAGAAGGLLLGLGIVLLAITLGVMPLDEATPLAGLGTGLLMGMAATVYGRSADRRRAA